MGKSGVLEHKSGDISETRIDSGKVTMGAYRNVLTLFPTAPSPTPYSLPSPRLGFAPHPKLQSLLSQELIKPQTSNWAKTITGSIRRKAHEKIWRKGSVGVSRSFPIFWGTPYYLRNGKSYEFQIWPVGYIYRVHPNKSP